MTINDIREQMTLQGNVRIQYWQDDECHVIFDDDIDELSWDSKWVNKNILFMFPVAMNQYEAIIIIELEME